MDGARTARIPARALTVVFGLILVAALGAGALTVGTGAQGEPPERLTEKELLSRVSAAPESAPDFRATVTVEQTLVPEGLLGASEGGDTGDSGPRTARVWRGGPDRLRAELQGENGDQGPRPERRPGKHLRRRFEHAEDRREAGGRVLRRGRAARGFAGGDRRASRGDSAVEQTHDRGAGRSRGTLGVPADPGAQGQGRDPRRARRGARRRRGLRAAPLRALRRGEARAGGPLRGPGLPGRSRP